jgi:mannosyltransferase
MDRRILGRGALLLLLLLSFAIRISGLTAQSLWRDEVDALRFSMAPLPTLVGNFTRIGWNGPLYYVLLRLWLVSSGSSELALRYFSLLFGVLGTAMIYRLGRDWHSPLVGGLAALLTACSPYLVWYSQEAKMYALLTATVPGLLYVYRRALSGRDGRLWVAVVILTWITIGLHIMGVLIVPVMVLLFLLWWPQSKAQWRQGLAALTICVLPGAAVLPWAFPLLLGGGDIGHRFVPLPAMIATMLFAFTRGIVDAGGPWATGLGVFALLAGTALWTEGGIPSRARAILLDRAPALSDEGRFVLALWAWIALPVAGLYAISTRVPMFVDRYLIWIGPAVYLLMARGLAQVRQRSRIAAGVCLAAFMALSGWGVWQQSHMPIKSDFRAAAAYVREHRQPDEVLLFHISYVRATFEYYYGDSSPTADGIPTDERTTQQVVDAEMRQRVGGYDVVWLILSEPEMWDQRGMTVAWLDEHAEADLRANFARVSVVRYRMNANTP